MQQGDGLSEVSLFHRAEQQTSIAIQSNLRRCPLCAASGEVIVRDRAVLA